MKLLALLLIMVVAISAWFALRTDLGQRKEIKTRTEQIDLALRQMRP